MMTTCIAAQEIMQLLNDYLALRKFEEQSAAAGKFKGCLILLK